MTQIENPSPEKFHIIFEDTILFPQGGGQCCDHGVLIKENSKIPVRNVFRKAQQAVHEVVAAQIPLKVGDEVLQITDWDRRFDFMQQHSGQHLLSNIFQREFGYETKSSGLGELISYIDLDVKDLTAEEIDKVERICNECIAKGIPVHMTIYEPNDPAVTEFLKAAPKEIPKDWTGLIRIIDIEGIGKNTCCGTHVNNLSQLNLLKIVNFEKKKGRVLVNFLVGQRVVKRLSEGFERERELIKLLNAPPKDHVKFIENLQSKSKNSAKTINKISKELALLDTQHLSDLENINFYTIFRNEGLDPTIFLNTLQKNFDPNNRDMFLIVAVSDSYESSKGSLLVQGTAEDMKNLKDQICEILDGKPNEKNGKIVTKVCNLDKFKDCKTLIETYFRNKS